MTTPEPLTPEQRQVALAKYATDRAHEVERDKVAAEYEHAHFKGLFALNGDAAAAFIAAQGKDVPLSAFAPERA